MCVCPCPRVLETTTPPPPPPAAVAAWGLQSCRSTGHPHPPEPIEPRLLRPAHRQVRARGLQTGAEPGRGGLPTAAFGGCCWRPAETGAARAPHTHPAVCPGRPEARRRSPGGKGRRGGSRYRLPSRLAAAALPSLPARRAEVTSYRRGAARGGCRRPPGILRRGRGVSGPAGAPRPDCAEGAGPGSGRAAPAEGRVTPGR